MHLVTDELLVEGKAGCYVNRCEKCGILFYEVPVWEGPFYGDDVQNETEGDFPEHIKGARDLWRERGVAYGGGRSGGSCGRSR